VDFQKLSMKYYGANLKGLWNIWALVKSEGA
jgi:hypothetical protein